MKTLLRKTVLALILPAVILAAWIYTTTFTQIPAGILPGIPRVWKAFLDMTASGQLQSDLAVSLIRVLKGFAVSAVLGITLGSLIGMFRPVREMLLPFITVVRQIPMIAWIPLIILWCGWRTLKSSHYRTGGIFPVLVNTESGIAGTPESFLEVAKLYKLNPWKTFAKVYLPHALPQILVGLRLGLGVSWMAVVAAELIAAVSGIGYRMSNARSLMRPDIVIVCMLVVGLVGILMDKVIGLIFGAFTPGKKAEK